MTPVIVVGVGSPFGADSVGLDAVEHLEMHPALATLNDSQLTLVSADRPGTELLNVVRGARLAILVDAVHSGGEPGELVRLEGDRIREATLRTSSHGVGVADTLTIGRALGDLPPGLVLYGLEVGSDGEWLPTNDSMDRLVTAVATEVAAYFMAA